MTLCQCNDETVPSVNTIIQSDCLHGKILRDYRRGLKCGVVIGYMIYFAF